MHKMQSQNAQNSLTFQRRSALPWRQWRAEMTSSCRRQCNTGIWCGTCSCLDSPPEHLLAPEIVRNSFLGRCGRRMRRDETKLRWGCRRPTRDLTAAAFLGVASVPSVYSTEQRQLTFIDWRLWRRTENSGDSRNQWLSFLLPNFISEWQKEPDFKQRTTRQMVTGRVRRGRQIRNTFYTRIRHCDVNSLLHDVRIGVTMASHRVIKALFAVRSGAAFGPNRLRSGDVVRDDSNASYWHDRKVIQRWQLDAAAGISSTWSSPLLIQGLHRHRLIMARANLQSVYMTHRSST